MNIYFYDIIPVRSLLEEWTQKRYPGHLLYGLPVFSEYGIKTILHHVPFNPYIKRIRLSFHSLKTILTCKENIDVVYAVTHRGLELLILLRAARLYKKPIAIWHHTAIVKSKNPFREALSRFFYRGIDRCYFFSDELLNRSLQTGKINSDKTRVIPWGPDLDFYNIFLTTQKKNNFISTGRENRDFITLLKALSQTKVSCEIFAPNYGLASMQEELDQLISSLPENIKFNYVNIPISEITQKVAESSAVLICCQNHPYTIGLTTLVEALALGKPIITTDNPTFPFDVEKEGIGIKVPFYDVESWVNAINYLATHEEEAQEMGRKARMLAENKFNLKAYSKIIAQDILNYKVLAKK